MAKSIQKIEAIRLRKSGNSIKEIATALSLSQSTVSLWCRDVVLSEAKRKSLIQKQIAGGNLGRIRSAEKKKQGRLSEISKYEEAGLRKFKALTTDELLLTGLGIYWGEGLKTGGVTGIVNSDPNLILLMIKWLNSCFNVKTADLVCRVGINESHSGRIKEIEAYWGKLTMIPIAQFTKPGIYRSKQAKIYDSSARYYGTLTIKVKKSTSLQREILGLLKGLYKAA
jgi:hypothetical protein